MELRQPNEKFIDEILKEYDLDGGNELNEKLLKLFKEFNNEQDKNEVMIKVAALNKIYSTAIMNINPVVERINSIAGQNLKLENVDDYVKLVDEIAKVEWGNTSGRNFKRIYISFASKYVHFCNYSPIYVQI